MTPNGESEQIKIDVSAQRIAQVYAEALLNAAEKQNQAREVGEELDGFVDQVLRARPDLETFLFSAAVGRDTRKALIQKTFQGRASELFTHFLLILNDHDRLELLRSIREAYREEYERRTNRLRVHIRSAVPLAEDQLQRVVERVRERQHREPVVLATVDPDLLGGLVIRIGDLVLDGSVRARIESIRNQLIERSSHEIQSGRDRFSS